MVQQRRTLQTLFTQKVILILSLIVRNSMYVYIRAYVHFQTKITGKKQGKDHGSHCLGLFVLIQWPVGTVCVVLTLCP